MTSPIRRAPFRAGLLEGETKPVFMEASHPALIIPGVVLAADASEFQRNIDASYLKWSGAIIIRAAYGALHDDRAWFSGDRRKFLHDNGAQYIGMYQYITAFEDVTSQAREFCRLIGTMRAGEDLYADIEEGSGNQQARWQTWAHVVSSELGWDPGNYSGLFFARDHGLQPVDWVAAYGTTEPSVPHKWWQFTSSFSIPGIGRGDCSAYHGNMANLRASAFGGSQQQDWTETAIMALPTISQGAVDKPGQVFYVRRVQALVKVIGQINGIGPAASLATDGTFGWSTKAGVEAVQGFFGLAQDGVVGKDTWRKLIGA